MWIVKTPATVLVTPVTFRLWLIMFLAGLGVLLLDYSAARLLKTIGKVTPALMALIEIAARRITDRQ